jgi:hypothetical protein
MEFIYWGCGERYFVGVEREELWGFWEDWDFFYSDVTLWGEGEFNWVCCMIDNKLIG